MSIVGRVGRNRWRARLALFTLYAVLCLGAITTLYPFAMMVAAGTKGAFDQNTQGVIPAYLSDAGALTAKYADDKYAGDSSLIASTRIGANASTASIEEYRAFLESLPPRYWSAGFKLAPNQVTSRLRARYQAWLRTKYKDIRQVNEAYLEENTEFQTIDTPAELLERKAWAEPATAQYREWTEFKKTLPADFRIPVRVTRLFQEWLRAKYNNRFASVPPNVAGSAKGFEQVSMPNNGSIREQFEKEGLPDRYKVESAETLWAAKHSGPMPIQADEALFAQSNRSSLTTEFATRNFAYVVDYILLNGRAVSNTVVFCFLAVLTQLLVNPLAAYALSRYPIKASGRILIFLLATMAFPAEVSMIPSFLLLKDLGLLNTFAALILPGAANGYMIFLLKGFFDSLPPELYEAGQLDGAPETVMMWRIAIPLSRPVLGYLALLAFMGAYSTFIYAFLVCQDQRLWTLMVWIYQLQSTAPISVMMAALTLAAVPTLAVFLLAQRTIMKGIILPGER